MRQFAIDCNGLQSPKNRLKIRRPSGLGGSTPLPAPIQINETPLDGWMALERRKRKGFSIDVFVKSPHNLALLTDTSDT